MAPHRPPIRRIGRNAAGFLLAGFLAVGTLHGTVLASGDRPEAGEAAEPRSGTWFDPLHDGEGLVLEKTGGDAALLYWFTYDASGNQRWFIADGTASPNALEFPVLSVATGGRFGSRFDPARIEYRPVGTARLSFDDCGTGDFTFTVDGTPGDLDLQRLAAPAGLECGRRAASPPPASGFSGSWYDPARDGEGFVIQVLADGRALVYWFTYRPNGDQAWLIGTGTVEESGIVVDPLYITDGGRFGASFDPGQVRLIRWGSLLLETTCETATARYLSRFERFGGGVLHLVRLTALAGTPCPEPAASAPPDEVSPDRPVAFTEVNVVPMTGLRVLSRQTVIVKDGRIHRMGPSGAVEIPGDAVNIDGRGRFLMPGLADMHVHLDRADLPRYVAHGITTVRNMWGFPGVRAMQADVLAGNLRGPTIYSTSPGLDATPPIWPYTQVVNGPDEADEVVRLQKENGWKTLKLYQQLSRESYDAIVASAGRQGLDYVGHTPTAVGLRRVLEAGQRSVEHLGGYERILNGRDIRGASGWALADTAGAPDLARLTRRAGTWNCPTLAIQLMLAPTLSPGTRSSAAENRRRMLKALHDAGAGLLVGTDSGIGRTRPGESIHTELAQFVAAGLTPYEALLGATRNAAEFLGEGGEFGVVAPGARADLILLDDNPLNGLQALESPLGVMVRGHWQGS